ncbi:MAG: AAA family ATPase [Meiothermus sp.]|nr:AAA family ATPase [Meiothermus sp.]
MLQIELLGSPRLRCNGQEVGLPRKAVALVAYLALEGRQSRSRLVEMLWGSSEEARGQHNLRQTLYRLGKSPLKAHIVAGREQLELVHFGLDIPRFLTQVEAQNWPEALATYKGEFLQGLELEEETYRDWLQRWRERLGRLWTMALEGQAKKLEADGKTQPALEVYLELIRHDELQEHFHRQAMRLYATLGQPEGALNQYKLLCKVLQQELALEPLPETQALAEQIRQRKTTPRVRPLAPHSPNFNPPLVGRAAALELLEAAWQRQNILLIAGPAGVGKSRLAKEWLADKEPYITLAGQPGDGPTPYASMTRWVRQALRTKPDLRLKSWIRLEASRLVPELWDTPPPPLDESTQVRFFSALVELLMEAHGSTTFLSEDEHYSDPWSLQALAVGLEQRWVSARLVITVRPEEVAPEVARRYRDWRERQRAVWLELEPLNAPEVAELIAHLSGRPARLFPERVYRATSGNPLFVLQTLQSLFESGELRLGEGDVWETPYDESTHDYTELRIAASVRQTILGRLERQGAAVRRSLEVAALITEATFDSKTLAEATALSAWEVSEALERASQARLIEAVPQGYRFSHDLIARAIAEALKPDRRRLISAHLAQHYTQQAEHPARVAGYFQAAGQPEQAIQWWLKAAQQAHSVRAFREADAYYRLALEAMPAEHPDRFEALAARFYLCRQVGMADLKQQLDLLGVMQHEAQTPLQNAHVWFYRGMVLDDQQDLAGAMEASRRAYEFALEVAPAEAFYPLIFVTHYQRDLGLLEQAHQDGLAALKLAQRLTPYHQIEAQLCHSLTLMLQGQPAEALDWIGQAECLMQQHSPAPSSFWLLQERIGIVRARVHLSQGRYAEAIGETEDILQKARQGGVQRQELVALLVRAEAWLGLGQTAEATLDLERAQELSENLRWSASEVKQLYAELELALHNPKAALRQAELALEAAGNHRIHQINALYSRSGAWLALDEQSRARADLEQALTLHGGTARFRSVSEQALRARLAMTME